MPSKPCRCETSNKEKRDAVHIFKQFLRRSHVPKSFLAVHFQLYSRWLLPAQSCTVEYLWGEHCGEEHPQHFHSVLTFKTCKDGWGWRTKPKKADTRYLGQTDLIMDPEGAIKVTDYRFSISGIWAVWLPLCFHCISSPLFPCFLLEALHWSTSEVKQALTRPKSCLLLLLWKQL